MWAVKEERSQGGAGRRGIWGRERTGECEPLFPGQNCFSIRTQSPWGAAERTPTLAEAVLSSGLEDSRPVGV